jgi:catalase
MAFYNQGARPNYLSSIDPIKFRTRTVDLDKTHGHFTGEAITFLTAIRPEDFNAPRALWRNVFDEPARERFINNVTGKMKLCKQEEPLKRQIAIFREVDPEIAERLEKSVGIKGYDGIANMKFNGSHNAMNGEVQLANDIIANKGKSATARNGAPAKDCHSRLETNGKSNGVNGK